MAYPSNLHLDTVRQQTEAVMAEVRAWARSHDVEWKRSAQSAMFEYPLGHHTSLCGWHGTGKGSRNYGDGFAILSLYIPSGEVRILATDAVDYVGQRAYFVTQEAKDAYLANLPKVMEALRSL